LLLLSFASILLLLSELCLTVCEACRRYTWQKFRAIANFLGELRNTRTVNKIYKKIHSQDNDSWMEFSLASQCCDINTALLKSY
jgi:hypothetical protein